jgi:hypothetical protein
VTYTGAVAEDIGPGSSMIRTISSSLVPQVV